jgi:hypothetical protein
MQRRREAGGWETNQRRLPLTDKELGTERNNEECGQGLWEGGVVCSTFYRVTVVRWGVGEGEQRPSVSVASMASVMKKKRRGRRGVGRALTDEGE